MSSVRFTETMTGFVALGAESSRAGWHRGKRAESKCTFRLTIEIDDVDSHLADDDDWATATGWVDCDLFGGRHPIEGGKFRLFDPVTDPRRRAMRYRLPFRDGSGQPVELVGKKDVGDDAGFDVWRDTTRLATEIRAGHGTGELEDTTSRILARGVVVITPLALARQMTTFRGTPIALARFFSAFASTLWRLYRGRTALKGQLA